MPNRSDAGEFAAMGWIAVVDLLILAVVLALSYGHEVNRELESEKTLRQESQRKSEEHAVAIAELQRQNASLERQLTTARDGAARLRTELEQTQLAIGDAERQIALLTAALEMKDAEIVALSQELSEASELSADLEKRLADAQDEIDRNKAIAQAAMAFLERVKSLAELGKIDASKTEDEWSRLEKLVRDLLRRYREAIAAREESKRIAEDLQEDLDNLRAKEVGFRRELLGIRSRGPALNRVVFVVDRSFSMTYLLDRRAGANVDRWTEVKDVVATWMRLLPANEAVLIAFGDSPIRFPQSGVVAAADSQKLIDELNGLKPQGMTDTLAALEMAYAVDEVDAIFLFTDGRPGTQEAGPGLLQRRILEMLDDQNVVADALGETATPINVVALGNYFGDPSISTALDTPGTTKPENDEPSKMTFGSFLVEVARKSGGTFIGR